MHGKSVRDTMDRRKKDRPKFPLTCRVVSQGETIRTAIQWTAVQVRGVVRCAPPAVHCYETVFAAANSTLGTRRTWQRSVGSVVAYADRRKLIQGII